LLAVSTDADLLAAITGSDTNEIEQMYVFSHGWGSEWEGGGLQLNNGPDRREDYSQFTDRTWILCCRIDLPQEPSFISTHVVWDIRLCHKENSPMRFEGDDDCIDRGLIEISGILPGRKVQRQWWFVRYNTWVDVAPGVDTGSAAHVGGCTKATVV